MVVDGADLVLPVVPYPGNGSLVRLTPDTGAITVIAGGTTAVNLAGSLTADAQRFYFTTIDGPPDAPVYGIYSMPRSGGTPVKIAETGQTAPYALTHNATALFWTRYDYGLNALVAETVPLAGGTTTVIAGVDQPTSIAADDTTVYWTAGMAQAEAPPDIGTVSSMPLAGGAPTVLATGRANPEALLLDGTSLYWTELGQTHVDCSAGPGAAMKMPTQGGALQTVVSGLVVAQGLGVSGGDVYAADMGGFCNDLPSSPKGRFFASASGASPVVRAKVEMVGSIVAAGGKVYFANTSYAGDVSEIRALE
jgi:hypothetical protein